MLVALVFLAQPDGSVLASNTSRQYTGRPAAFKCASQQLQQRLPEQDPTLSVAVRVYDYAGIPEEVAFAETVANEIFRRADIAIRWVDACVTGAQTRLQVNLLTASMVRNVNVPSDVLGFAYAGIGQANVVIPRVRVTAITHKMTPAQLLGIVMAHELGHLLLPARSHTPVGLMSANMDLNRVRIGAFRFSSQEAALMIERLWNVTKWQPGSDAQQPGDLRDGGQGAHPS